MSGHRGVQQETPRPRAGARAARRFTLVPPADGRVVVPAEPPVELLGVSKIFSGDGPSAVYAVRGVDLVLPPGSATLVEGPSGSGKTTLLGLVACLVRPTAGRIRVGGVETTRLPEDRLAELRRRRFGFVFQAHHLIRGATALDNVVVPALPRPEVDGDLRPRAFALLGQLGLAARANERVERLSGGEQQRVAIARALINDPPVLLADEPTAHLDPESTAELLELLEKLYRSGTTLVVASHDPAICGSDLFDRRFELRGGRLRERSASWC